VLAAGLLVFACETVGKLRAVVGQDLADLDGRIKFDDCGIQGVQCSNSGFL
jgi:hypothetical protein